VVPTTILVDGVPRCVVRPTDMKALNRFLRGNKTFLLRARPDGAIDHRVADAAELTKFQDAFDLHKAGGGDEEEFFGTPL
jgi:hypothetical protein